MTKCNQLTPLPFKALKDLPKSCHRTVMVSAKTVEQRVILPISFDCFSGNVCHPAKCHTVARLEFIPTRPLYCPRLARRITVCSVVAVVFRKIHIGDELDTGRRAGDGWSMRPLYTYTAAADDRVLYSIFLMYLNIFYSPLMTEKT